MLLDVVFYAGCAREEGRPLRFQLAFISPDVARDSSWSHVTFQGSYPLEAELLRRLGPTTEPGRTLVGVFRRDGSLHVWGLIHLPQPNAGRAELPCLVITALAPARIVARMAPDDVFLYSGGQGRVLDRTGTISGRDLVLMLAKGLAVDPHWIPSVPQAALLLAIARGALDAGHGATIVVLPGATPRTDLIHYRFPIQSANLVAPTASVETFEAQRRFLTSLCAVDGALILAANLELLGFAAVLPTRPDVKDLGVVVVDPAAGLTTRPAAVPLSTLGLGTRHRSAIDFCDSSPGAIAMVVSQDGELSLVTRPLLEEHAVVLRPFYPGTAGLA